MSSLQQIPDPASQSSVNDAGDSADISRSNVNADGCEAMASCEDSGHLQPADSSIVNDSRNLLDRGSNPLTFSNHQSSTHTSASYLTPLIFEESAGSNPTSPSSPYSMSSDTEGHLPCTTESVETAIQGELRTFMEKANANKRSGTLSASSFCNDMEKENRLSDWFWYSSITC